MTALCLFLPGTCHVPATLSMLFMCSWPTLYVFQPCWYPSSRSRIAIPRFPSCGCGTAALSEKEKLHGRKEPCGYFFSHHQQLVQLYPNPIRSSIDVLNTSFALPSWRIPCQTLAHGTARSAHCDRGSNFGQADLNRARARGPRASPGCAAASSAWFADARTDTPAVNPSSATGARSRLSWLQTSPLFQTDCMTLLDRIKAVELEGYCKREKFSSYAESHAAAATTLLRSATRITGVPTHAHKDISTHPCRCAMPR